MKKFKVNDYITLKLKNGETYIYVKEERFLQCKYLLLNIPVDDVSSFDEIISIDEAEELLDNSLEPEPDERQQSQRKEIISPEVEFWGHCSNLQVWAEMNYDTRLLHRNIAFPLLKKLVDVGDPIAKKIFRKEIIDRILSGYSSVVEYLVLQDYLKYLPIDIMNYLLNDSKSILFCTILKLLEDHDYKIKNKLIALFQTVNCCFSQTMKNEFFNEIKNSFQYVNYLLENKNRKYKKFLDSLRDFVIKETELKGKNQLDLFNLDLLILFCEKNDQVSKNVFTNFIKNRILNGDLKDISIITLKGYINWLSKEDLINVSENRNYTKEFFLKYNKEPFFKIIFYKYFPLGSNLKISLYQFYDFYRELTYYINNPLKTDFVKLDEEHIGIGLETFLWKISDERIKIGTWKINQDLINELYCIFGDIDRYSIVKKNPHINKDVFIPVIIKIHKEEEVIKRAFRNNFEKLLGSTKYYSALNLFECFLRFTREDELSLLEDEIKNDILNYIIEIKRFFREKENAKKVKYDSIFWDELIYKKIRQSLSKLVKKKIINIINESNHEEFLFLVEIKLLDFLKGRDLLFLIQDPKIDLILKLVKFSRNLKENQSIFRNLYIIPPKLVKYVNKQLKKKIREILGIGDVQDSITLIRLKIINSLRLNELMEYFENPKLGLMENLILTFEEYFLEVEEWIIDFFSRLGESISKPLIRLITRKIENNEPSYILKILDKGLLDNLNENDFRNLWDSDLNFLHNMLLAFKQDEKSINDFQGVNIFSEKIDSYAKSCIKNEILKIIKKQDSNEIRILKDLNLIKKYLSKN